MAEKWDWFPLFLVLIIGLLAVIGIGLQSSKDAITGFAVVNSSHIKSSLRPTCNETDRGYDWYIKGITTYAGSSYKPKNDTCIGSYVLHEYYCSNNRRQSKKVTCPIGYRCQDGACKLTAGNVPYTIKLSEYRERLTKKG